MIAIIDYGMGNLRSVEKALQKTGARNVLITSNAQDINKADKIVMPGVGAMNEAVRQLEERKLIKAIKENIFKKPYLGICLGLQLLFEKSEEGPNARGLGIIKGTVRRFTGELKIPHMGWNQIRFTKDNSRILEGIPDGSYFYFCHSFYCRPLDKTLISATTDYKDDFVSVISKDNLFAVQFHPEKSQELGLKLLNNFVKL